MIRFYGEKPYRAAVIHGGPGDIGGMRPVAERLGKTFGVMEPIQSQYTTIALVMELRRQLGLLIKEPITLIGHSWGAWLSLLVASCYPFLVERVVLVGCPPLEEIYAGHIHERRMKRLSKEEQERFIWYMKHMAAITAEGWEDLRQLMIKADHYAQKPNASSYAQMDGKMYERVWPEAIEMRRNGNLMRYIQSVACPIHIIHGDYDPHPLEGIINPLDSLCIPYRLQILQKCGHAPFDEIFAEERFYQILEQILRS